MDIPASEGGVVREVRVRVGDKVSLGTVLATIETSAQRSAQTPPPAVAPQAAPAPALAAAISPSAPSRNGGQRDGAERASAHASPAVRRFARELGVELAGVTGSGPNNRITREDVQSFVKHAMAAAPAARKGAPALGIALPPWPAVDFAKYGPVERVPLSRIKRLSGPNLLRNWLMIPHVTQNDEADITELEALRKRINAENKDAKVTMLAFVMKAVVAAMRRYPDFNSSLDGDELVIKKYYNIGFAADTPGGLVVPVLREADRKGVLEIAREAAELAAKAREGKLGVNDMQGGTFTISSLGGIGGTSFTPIVNAPEVAILGVTRAAMRPIWDGATFVPRLMLPLSLSYDHRVIDGAAAARFCVHLAELLADMRKTLL
jgi:pyruvate dehydrogenase E2 component (dihydrolipoamide acetyltransferase)